MEKIKFNTTTSNFTLILMVLLFTSAFIFMLYYMITNSIYDSSTIFPLVLFGIFATIFIFAIFESGDFVQELSINESYAIFSYINSGKNKVKAIKLEDIENFNVDIDIKHYLRSTKYYINFSIKTKNSDEIQSFCTNDNCSPKGICSLFDIQEMIPNFTYNITSNNDSLKNSLLHYAENKKFSDSDIKNQNNLKKIVIIFIIIMSLILIPMICSIVSDLINMQ